MSLQISRILHAGYLLETDKARIAFDPIFENPFSRNCFAFPSVQFDLKQIQSLQLSAVFISHFHDDHLSLTSLHLLDRQTPIYLFSKHDEFFELIHQLGFSNVIALHPDQPVYISDITVTPKRALDEDVDSLFHIQIQNLNILNVVDSWIDDEVLKDLAKTNWDLILWPFQTMRELEVISPLRAQASSQKLPPEWLEQLQILNPRTVIPSSCQFQMEKWSWYNQAFFPISYSGFAQQIHPILPTTKIQRLDPGGSLIWKSNWQPGPQLPWIKPLESETVDYTYKPDVMPTPTQEIARHFPALTPDEQNLVFDFCRNQIPDLYKDVAESEDEFFQKPRLWRLSLFDHQGKETVFAYQVQKGNITPVKGDTETLSWTTEIPVSRLWGALQDGEALTSLYIRINNQIFDDEIERDLRDVELTEDPLVRCLYTGKIGSYQKAQLARLGLAKASEHV